ncbi:MAG: C-GCAxxG-C-C family protein [Pseudomonadota bacterium]|nr:C-GCAxxG-C-C family protein [Pseudomonadota bacterium]
MELSRLDKYPDKAKFLEEWRMKAFNMEMQNHGCSQVVVQTFLDLFEEDNVPLFKAASPFAAGMSLTGHNCGALVGGLMALGTVFGRKDIHEGMDGILSGVRPCRKLVRYFQDRHQAVNCRDITGADLADPQASEAYFEGGGLEKCSNIIADVVVYVADLLYEENQKRKS